MFDVMKIRQDFPMIRNNPELIYFDNGATTYKPDAVINAINEFYSYYTSNVERGDYDNAIKADKAYLETRAVIAKMINCSPKEVAFNANVTAALNQIAFSLGRMLLKENDTVLITYNEHASNVLPWFRLKKDIGINVKYIPLDIEGNIDIDEFEKCLDSSVKVVSIAYQSNVLGSIQPLKEIAKLVHDNNGLLVVDAAQAIGHRKVDVKEIDCDFLCFSAHKMCGPDGVGVLYGKYELLDKMEPIFLGGGMNARFDADGNIIYKNAPAKFEAGTPNIEGVIGLKAASEYLMNIGLDNIYEYEKELRAFFAKQLSKCDNLEIYNLHNLSAPLTFNVKGVFAQDAAGYLSSKNIAVRSGNHCAKILHNLIGTDQTIRASLYLYNTKEEVDRFVSEASKISLESAIDVFI